MSFTGYPLPDDFTNATPALDVHAAAHNNVNGAANDLQDQVTDLATQIPLEGTGSPEGVVSAPVGRTYSRTDGGTNTTFYVKETGGAGNTGWVANAAGSPDGGDAGTLSGQTLAQVRVRSSHTGQMSADFLDTGSTNAAYTLFEQAKLATVEANATAISAAADIADFDVAARVALVHDWDVDGWTPWTTRVVTADPPDTTTTSVTTPRRGRLTGQAVATDGDRRVLYARTGTDTINSRIRSLWWGSNVYDAAVATPQMMVMHRCVDLGGGAFIAVVISNNVFLTDPNVVNVNLWHFDGTTITQGNVIGQKDFGAVLNRSLSLTSAERFSFGVWVNSQGVAPTHLYGMATGDLVDVSSTDTTFNATAVAVTGVNTIRGSITHTETTTTSTVALKVDAGTVTPAKHKRYWPMEMISELVGVNLRLKVWRYQDPEPDWGQAANVFTYDISASTNLTEPSTAGFSGVGASHLRSSAYVEFGRVEFTKLP